ncbi:uncharacterized protein [Henckelia pumila]|uniref:uncharacterized protein n=1 Tax=Henckelia pumila TaxID=405737 RepID=UPI003C6DECB4
MDSSSVSNSFLKPPILDGANYALWKHRMRYTIKAMDVRAWQSILTGWTPPTTQDDDGDYIIKREENWTTEDTLSSSYNAKALNAILATVDMRMYGIISDCTIAKDAWDALQEHCEGTDSKLREIATEAHALGGPIASEAMVNKVLRSLPKRFNGKIWALEEVKDTSKMKMTELISILQVFEMNNSDQEKDKGKLIAFQASKPSYEEYVQFHQEPLRITGPEQSPKKPTDISKPRMMVDEKKKFVSKKLDKVQCHACQGFGHYANEYANTLRKGMNTSLSDEESEEEEHEDEESHTALSALLESKKKFQVRRKCL